MTKNITALIDANGAIAESYDYDAFGNPVIAYRAPANQPTPPAVSTASTANNRFLFSSEYHDSELGVSYYNCRHYNPMDGRWTNRDPIEEEFFAVLFDSGTECDGEFAFLSPEYGFVNNSVIMLHDSLGLRIDCGCGEKAEIATGIMVACTALCMITGTANISDLAGPGEFGSPLGVSVSAYLLG